MAKTSKYKYKIPDKMKACQYWNVSVFRTLFSSMNVALTSVPPAHQRWRSSSSRAHSRARTSRWTARRWAACRKAPSWRSQRRAASAVESIQKVLNIFQYYPKSIQLKLSKNFSMYFSSFFVYFSTLFKLCGYEQIRGSVALGDDLRVRQFLPVFTVSQSF